MPRRPLFSIVVCAVALGVGATAAGCSGTGIDDSTSPAIGNPSSSTVIAVTAPSTTLPLTQTPEYVASNTPCPAGLRELGAVELRAAAPGHSVGLSPFLQLPDATVMVFDPVGSGPRRDGGFVGDRRGRIWRFEVNGTGAAELGAEPVADFSSNTAAEHDQGLVGMTFGPNGRLWINRTDRHGDSVLTVLTPTADGSALLGGFTDVLAVSQTNAQHNGGALLFGPDGLLYVSFGDGGGLGDPHHHGQNLATPLGAILRFAVVDGGSSDTGDWRLVPALGNPDLDAGSDPRIWAYGARNPFQMTLDDETATLWVADVGQQCMEEVTVLGLDEGGANLGWNSYEGSRRFVGDELDDHRVPDFEYRHGRGLCAVIGGHVYRGSELSWLAGRYVFADLCGGDVYAVSVQPGTQPDEVWSLGISTQRPVGFAEDHQGELYVIDIETGVRRLTG
ncbi:PQQ-dependent sugar dehydrogenase [Candidatus Poriferisodalis sp.]|uniref:PQQ-dependent sugar dehydrogenase n=1 Tax=Candidatus Poriferisodalis sp. TaxID=3101277 RepID=UPI003B019F1E